MIRTGVKIQLLVFLIISLVGTAYVGSNYVGIGQSHFTVKAHFSDSGGVFSNAEVDYRGIRVGKVGPLHLVPDGVVVDLLIDKGKRSRATPRRPSTSVRPWVSSTSTCRRRRRRAHTCGPTARSR